MKYEHNSWDTVKELFRCESPKDAMIAEHLFNKIASEYAMLKKQLDVAVKALHKISKCVADTLQGCDVEAKESIAEIKRIGSGE